jgi:hypothetical protein
VKMRADNNRLYSLSTYNRYLLSTHVDADIKTHYSYIYIYIYIYVCVCVCVWMRIRIPFIYIIYYIYLIKFTKMMRLF